MRIGRIDTGCFKTSAIGNRNRSGVAPGRLIPSSRVTSREHSDTNPYLTILVYPPYLPSSKPAAGALLHRQQNRAYRRTLAWRSSNS